MAPAPPEKAAGYGSYLAYRSLAGILQRLPSAVTAPAGAVAGAILSRAQRDERRIVRKNLARVLGPSVSPGELDRAVEEAFRSYARYWVESARLKVMTPGEVLERFSIEGFEPARLALDERRGAIFALPHLGSWEIGGYWLTLKGHPMTTVVEPLEPPELFEWFQEQRRALGLHILPLGPGATERLVKTLHDGGLVGLVADRDLKGHGVEVSFFGETTTLPGGPALLSLRTGAPLFPVAVYQHAHGYYHGVVRDPLAPPRTGHLRDDVRELTSALARQFEELIALAPTQWHLFQPNWPSDRSR